MPVWWWLEVIDLSGYVTFGFMGLALMYLAWKRRAQIKQWIFIKVHGWDVLK